VLREKQPPSTALDREQVGAMSAISALLIWLGSEVKKNI
jgi:hypothetical protein